MALMFTKEPCERLRFVVQTGGYNPKVIGEYSGIESFMIVGILNNSVKLTPKGRILVFGLDDTYRGYIKLVDGFPHKYKLDPLDEGTVFNDWYTEVCK